MLVLPPYMCTLMACSKMGGIAGQCVAAFFTEEVVWQKFQLITVAKCFTRGITLAFADKNSVSAGRCLLMEYWFRDFKMHV